MSSDVAENFNSFRAVCHPGLCIRRRQTDRDKRQRKGNGKGVYVDVTIKRNVSIVIIDQRSSLQRINSVQRQSHDLETRVSKIKHFPLVPFQSEMGGVVAIRSKMKSVIA